MSDARSTVTMVAIREHRTLRVLEDRYKFIPVGRLAWLWRWMFKTLRQRGGLVSATTEDLRYETLCIDGDRLVQRINKSRRAVIEARRTPTHILVGWEDFMEFEALDPSIAPQVLDFKTAARCGDNVGTYFMGLRVQVIPWMRGVLVMP